MKLSTWDLKFLEPKGIRTEGAGVSAGGVCLFRQGFLWTICVAGIGRRSQLGGGVLQPANESNHNVRSVGDRIGRRSDDADEFGGADQPDSVASQCRSHGGNDRA